MFSMVSPVPSLSVNVQFCFNEPGHTLFLLLKSNRLKKKHIHKKIVSEAQNFVLETLRSTNENKTNLVEIF